MPIGKCDVWGVGQQPAHLAPSCLYSGPWVGVTGVPPMSSLRASRHMGAGPPSPVSMTAEPLHHDSASYSELEAVPPVLRL